MPAKPAKSAKPAKPAASARSVEWQKLDTLRALVKLAEERLLAIGRVLGSAYLTSTANHDIHLARVAGVLRVTVGPLKGGAGRVVDELGVEELLEFATAFDFILIDVRALVGRLATDVDAAIAQLEDSLRAREGG